MEGKLEAHYQNRTYYFFITEKKPLEVAIEMYNTRYSLIKKGEHWVNHPSNKMEMSTGLTQAVIEAIKEVPEIVAGII